LLFPEIYSKEQVAEAVCRLPEEESECAIRHRGKVGAASFPNGRANRAWLDSLSLIVRQYFATKHAMARW